MYNTRRQNSSSIWVQLVESLLRISKTLMTPLLSTKLHREVYKLHIFGIKNLIHGIKGITVERFYCMCYNHWCYWYLVDELTVGALPPVWNSSSAKINPKSDTSFSCMYCTLEVYKSGSSLSKYCNGQYSYDKSHVILCCSALSFTITVIFITHVH